MAADDAPAVAVTAYVDAFNRGDSAAMVGCFAANGVILDGMAPHLWNGPSAASDWYRDALEEGEHLGVSGYALTLGAPAHDQVSGDAAYLVAPASLSFEIGGRRVTQTGATLTFALTREAGGWKIAAWAWAKGQPE